MERSFKAEVELLKLGDGGTFHGEGILAVTKAMLQSGVSYIGGYQGAPVSHMMDVLADARPILDELGIHVETNASEAGAAAMLGASINYPMRGTVTFKSTVGTNVASDALSNLASAGVTGGVVVVLGEDYGEGASIIQERSHAFAMKSQMWLLDPRPNLPTIVKMVEKGFELSEASSTPVLLELRIRACHVHGSFETKDNVAPRYSRKNPLPDPDFDFSKICLPPATYAQEKQKIEVRWPAAQAFIRENKLNEVFAGSDARISAETGIIVQGGMYNVVIRSLQQLGLADAFGSSRIPIYVLNVTYPLIPEEVVEFCAGKRTVMMVEESQPAFIEDALNGILRRADLQTRVHGQDVLPLAGEFTGAVVLEGMMKFLEKVKPTGLDVPSLRGVVTRLTAPKATAAELFGEPLPVRVPGFCIGCPERPVLSALKLAARDGGKFHVSGDIGCHTFSTLPPFNMGNTVLGYGLGLASNSAVAPMFNQRSVTIMGDGGFWHNGLTSGVANAVFNKDDGVLVILENGYTSATGTQNIPSSPHHDPRRANDMSIEKVLRSLGVTWLKRVHSYSVTDVANTIKDAMTTAHAGLKVIISDSECQLERQRRIRPQIAQALKAGERVVRTRFGVDENLCTGDHSCIRLSGCPSLTVKPSSDPLKLDPVAHVNNGCVGCGLCGEVAHAAILCPSFFRADIVQNPGTWDRFIARVRETVIGWLQPRESLARTAS